MDEDRLRSALRELDTIPAQTALSGIVGAARRRRRLYALAGALGLSAVIAAGITLAPSIMDASDPSPSRPPAASGLPAAAAAAWQTTVTVTPDRIGPLGISVSEPVDVLATESKPWREHEIVFTNHGEEPLHFDDTRTSVMLSTGGSAALLAGDEGCGYGRSSSTGPVEAGACDRYLDAFTVPPGASTTRVVTLWKELPGMSDLGPGTYVWEKTLRFASGDAASESHVVRVRYEVQRAD